MINYYNQQAAEWEPFIEKTKVHFQIESKMQDNKLIILRVKDNLNINITDNLMQILIQTYISLQ